MVWQAPRRRPVSAWSAVVFQHNSRRRVQGSSLLRAAASSRHDSTTSKYALCWFLLFSPIKSGARARSGRQPSVLESAAAAWWPHTTRRYSSLWLIQFCQTTSTRPAARQLPTVSAALRSAAAKVVGPLWVFVRSPEAARLRPPPPCAASPAGSAQWPPAALRTRMRSDECIAPFDAL